MQHSKYQLDIFNAVKNTNSNICVEACPGSGKTSTLLEILKIIPLTKKAIFLSFSNTIVNELKSRVPLHIKASTLHSLGCRMVMSYHKRVQIDNDKWFKKLVGEFKAEERVKENFKFCGQTSEIINYARMTLANFTEEGLTEMCNYYNLDYKSKNISKAIEHLTKPEKWLQKIDFTDMIYLPATNSRLVSDQYDFVMLDEAQDLNNAQRAFLERIIKPGGRLIAVGDSQQSIYSFSGSSIDSFDKLKQRPNTTTLPLSISYRCSKAVVNEARKIYETIEAFEGNQEGIVRSGSLSEVREGDMVICRKTAPLVLGFFELLSANIKAIVIGKDIETGLINFAERIQTTDIDRTQKKIEDEREALRAELKTLGFKNISSHPKYVSLLDKIEVIELILRKITNPMNLVTTIKELFHQDKQAVRLMTIHRSKGLECDRVFIIEKHNNVKLSPSPFAIKDWEFTQESNLEFVACTRAKTELIYVCLNE